eukprot:11075333-Alexandrium_andersonii.AAC.1
MANRGAHQLAKAIGIVAARLPEQDWQGACPPRPTERLAKSPRHAPHDRVVYGHLPLESVLERKHQ